MSRQRRLWAQQGSPAKWDKWEGARGGALPSGKMRPPAIYVLQQFPQIKQREKTDIFIGQNWSSRKMRFSVPVWFRLESSNSERCRSELFLQGFERNLQTFEDLTHLCLSFIWRDSFLRFYNILMFLLFALANTVQMWRGRPGNEKKIPQKIIGQQIQRVTLQNTKIIGEQIQHKDDQITT